MIIDFKNIEQNVMSQFKGGNGDTIAKIFFDGQNKIMTGHLDVGCSIGYHQHETNSEIILITSGVARCLYDDGEERLTAGDCHYCPKGHFHSLINASDTERLEFFAVVAEERY